jgi:hypothetical protein
MDERGPDRWQRIEQLLDAALDVPPAERAELLRTACAGDEALLREVSALIEAGSGPAPADRRHPRAGGRPRGALIERLPRRR